jgi:hypothetical protein
MRRSSVSAAAPRSSRARRGWRPGGKDHRGRDRRQAVYIDFTSLLSVRYLAKWLSFRKPGGELSVEEVLPHFEASLCATARGRHVSETIIEFNRPAYAWTD